MRVPACPVIAALRRHELVNGGQRLRVARGDVNLAAPRKRIELISNRVLFPGHGSDTGHFAHVDKRRRVEVASGESKGNLSQVLTNLSNLRRIALIALQFDAAAVGECIKAVGGRVLVHAHCHTATRLAIRSVLRRFAAGELLWRAGTESRGLFIVLEGQVRVVRAPAGRQHVIHTEGAGATLGEVPLFAGGRYPATAIAADTTLCLVVGPDALTAAIAADPGLALLLLERLACRVRGLVERLDALAARSVRARLAGYLLARQHALPADEFTLGASQTAVAEELGTVREVVVRELRYLCDAGLLRRAGSGRFAVADMASLQRIASPT